MFGYIKLHRRLMENPIWTSEKFTRGQAWVDLILKANAQPGYVRKHGSRINLERGDVGYSIKELSRQWGWSESKTRRYLKELEDDGMVTLKKTNVSCTITLLNYDYWQSNDWQTRRDDDSADGAQSNTQTARKRYPNNKDNKIIRKKEEGGGSTPLDNNHVKQFVRDYPSLNVILKEKKYRYYCKTKSMEPTVAGFGIWLDEDVEYQKDKSNDIVGIKSPPSIYINLVELYCPQCRDSRVVARKVAWKTICRKCEEQMVEKNELPFL